MSTIDTSLSQAPVLAIAGNPNSGKTALFNRLTGARQKVANYSGVTVEKRSGVYRFEDGGSIQVVDLPGTYSLSGATPDERVAKDVLTGAAGAESVPDAVLCVVDATNLRRHLRFVLELKAIGRPILLALNMIDLANRAGIEIDTDILSQELQMPVIPTVAVRRTGMEQLLAELRTWASTARHEQVERTDVASDLAALQREANRIADAAVLTEGSTLKFTRLVDDIVLHPVAGLGILFATLFLMFQAVFAWAEAPMSWIDGSIVALQGLATNIIPDGMLRSVVVEGILAGVGSVVIFLPQIIILFAFILFLEASGYLPRAAFLMDKLMAGAGLNGRAFIPLLSSFACAIPGIMAARVIDDPSDRLTTIMIAPLMTCSARLPVYAIIIAAFIPNTPVLGVFGLQGVVLFVLYLAGIVSAFLVAWVLKNSLTEGAPAPFLMELPSYKVPNVRDYLLGLWERASIFIRRAGGIIFISMLVLWVLATFPGAPADATEPAINYSFAGMLGQALQPLFAPLGFAWEQVVALIPGMAAREVAVAALGTVYAISGTEEEVGRSLVTILQSSWTLPSALSFLAWYVYAPQCISTLAVAKRETNSWTWPTFMFVYLVALAYGAAFLTYMISSAMIGTS